TAWHRRAALRCGQKKAGLVRARLRYWPREADTITFQEGLLNVRATGGGGQMRNAKAQRTVIMGCVVGLQQPPEPHVRHADSGGSRGTPSMIPKSGHRFSEKIMLKEEDKA